MCKVLDGVGIIPDDITYISRRNGFRDCEDLVSINIPNNITTIGIGAFDGCVNLKHIIIPDSVTEIEDQAFSGCENLECITIPRGVEKIGLEIFSGCTSLKSINVDEYNPCFDSRGGCNAVIDTESNTLMIGCKTTIIPESVSDIYERAFSGCLNLTDITIPANIKTIGEYAFDECTALRTVTLSEGIRTIDYAAFNRCISLESIILPASLDEIDGSAFADCENLKSISVARYSDKELINTETYYSIDGSNAVISRSDSAIVIGTTTTAIPECVENIASRAFYSCKGLTEIALPDSVKEIGKLAFWGCSNLSKVCLNDGLAIIEDGAFEDCPNIRSFIIPNTVERLGEFALGRDSIESITFLGQVDDMWASFGKDIGAIYIPKNTMDFYKESIPDILHDKLMELQ